MANTEKIKTIQYIRTAQDAVTAALDKSGLNAAQRRLLDDLSDFLRDLETFLVMCELNDCIDGLKKKSKRLNALNARTKKQIDSLKEVAKAVDKAADVIGGLAKAVAILAQVGLM